MYNSLKYYVVFGAHQINKITFDFLFVHKCDNIWCYVNRLFFFRFFVWKSGKIALLVKNYEENINFFVLLAYNESKCECREIAIYRDSKKFTADFPRFPNWHFNRSISLENDNNSIPIQVMNNKIHWLAIIL